MAEVVDDLIATRRLRDARSCRCCAAQDLQAALVDDGAVAGADPDLLAGPFAHVVVDEAQELTDAQWQMLLRRCPSRSLTIVGDRAQARHGFTESWEERLARVGLDRVALASLTVNYRTPEEVMAAAEPVIRAALPDANVPTSVRSSGVPVLYGAASERDASSASGWRPRRGRGVRHRRPLVRGTGRVRSLTPVLGEGAGVRPRRPRRPRRLRRRASRARSTATSR